MALDRGELPDETVTPVAAILRLAIALHHDGIPREQIAPAIGTPNPRHEPRVLGRAWGAVTIASSRPRPMPPRPSIEAVAEETMGMRGDPAHTETETMRMIPGTQ